MKKNEFLYLVLTEGFVVLSLQILCSVIITPFWGATFTFWSLQLLFVMLGLSAAYYITPAWLRKRHANTRKQISSVLVFSLAYLLLLFLISNRFLFFLLGSLSSPVSGICVTLFFWILVPVAVLGSLPILVIEGQREKTHAADGERAGQVFFVSSAAGIVAVLFCAFVSVPYWGPAGALALVVVVLSLSIYAFLKSDRKPKFAAFMPALALLGGALLVYNSKNADKQLEKRTGLRVREVQEGVLGQLKVIESPKAQTRFLYVNNSLQSKTHVSGRSLYPYVYSLVMYSRCRPSGSEVLLAGMGAGSLAYEYDRMDYKVDVVDIDGRLAGVAERNFLRPMRPVQFTESDIRRYIKQGKKKYDIVVFDLSKGESVPTNVYTLESFRECRRSLKPKGILLIHFLSSLSEDGLTALASVKRTLQEAGFSCELMNQRNQRSLTDGVADPEKPEGFIFMASADKIDLSRTDFFIDSSIIKELVPRHDRLFLDLDEKKGHVLTDDRPLLDVLQADNAMKMRKQNIEILLQLNQRAK